jgi:hypothetical protein
MQKFKPGLQKEITAIFEGVRIPKEGRPQQSPGTPAVSETGDLGSKPLLPNSQVPPISPTKQVSPVRNPQPRWWAAPAAAAPKRSKVASIIKTFKEMPLRIFRPRAKLSEKRRSAMARHLLS